MKRVRSLLCLAGSAVAVVALASPAQAVDNGSYLIRDLNTGRCLAPADDDAITPAALGDCTPWKVTNRGDGTVQIAKPGNSSRCLASFPPDVVVGACDRLPYQRWVIQAPGPRIPTTIRNADRDGCVTVDNPNSPAFLGYCFERTWVLESAG
ncbi:hypothetical protein ABH937_003659 [Kitasatospora sp. GAS1066B]